MLKRLTIKQLLVLAFVIAGLLPAILVSALSFYQARSVIKQEIKRDLKTSSAALANDLTRMFNERMRNVQSWSKLAVMQELKIDDIDKRLSIFLNGLSESYGEIYRAMYVEDENGVVIASADAKYLGTHLPPREPWFKATLDDRQLVFYKLNAGVLPISSQVFDETTGLKLGTLVVDFNWQMVAHLLNHATDSTSAAALFNQQYDYLATTPNWQKIESAHGMKAVSQLESEGHLPEWHIRIEKLHEVAIAPVHQLGYAFLGVLLLLLLLAGLFVRPIATAITQPINKLTDFVRSFTGQAHAVPPQSGPPEVRELGEAFETMMLDLEKSQADLTRGAKLAVVGEMAAAMSHEVRTPLGILRSSADVLKREPDLSAEGKEVVSFISAETERLNKLVTTLIDAARPRPPSFVPTDVGVLLQQNLGLLKTQADKKQVALAYEASEDAILASIDADQITQAIMNLVMNAIQVLPTGGNVLVKLSQDASETLIEVMDDGQGIDTSVQKEIFEPFFTNRAGGVGLGLAIVRQILEAHQGSISYQTSPLGGAQFNLKIPRHLHEQ